MKTTNQNNEATAPANVRPSSVSKRAESAKVNIYDQITERIISLLEAGTVPWRKPWNVQAGLPRNLVSKKPYRGINVWLLHSMHYESPYWLTFRQALELGGNVRKGEKACRVMFCKLREIEDEKTGETDKIPMLRFYYVFNVAQCEGLKNVPAPAETLVDSLIKPEAIVTAMSQRPDIKHGKALACYSPSTDTVFMPDHARFEKQEGYYATLFHELIHSTGHPTRLHRPTLTESAGFGSNPYCKEELVAEMGAAFLCGHAGIGEMILENSAAYVQNWLEQLRNDKKLIVQAAAQAQRATDFILGVKFEEATAAEKQPATGITVMMPDED
ncbi:MAG: ArdC family protein [Limisphaerales bacterium]